jgi:phosphatidate cytidylyltransferase
LKNANGQFSGSEGRRSSFSDKSEEGSPTRTRAQNQAKLAPVDEVSYRTLL